MATEKQLAANRANALHSTGPKTDAGKSASSQNAAQHSLAAKGPIILPGQQPAYDDLAFNLRDSLVPSGALQELIFKRALESAWKLERCRLAEQDLYATSVSPDLDPMVDPDIQARYANIQRYAREAENSLYKAMRELGKLQSEAQFRHESFPLTKAQSENEGDFAQSPHALSEVCDFTHVMKQVHVNRRTQVQTHGIATTTELKALAHLHPNDFLARYEPNSLTAAAAA